MKASELNGTHLGRRATVTEDGNSATGVLGEILHRSSVITDGSFGGRTFESIGATWVDLELLGGFNCRVTPKAEVTIHGHNDTPAPRPARGAHHLTENANADPICHCGWDPARETFPVVRSREQARNDIRLHIADSKGAQ